MVEHLTSADKNDLIDFIDLVFSQAHQPHSFAKLLPKLYGANADTMQWHYAVKEGNHLMAAVLNFPYEIQVGNMRLKATGIGSVSSHTRSRGKGYMKDIMKTICKDLKDQKVDISWLGGQRQRYQYFGYESCGGEYCFLLTATNLRHYLGHTALEAYDFLPYAKASEVQRQEVCELHQKQTIHVIRPYDQMEVILQSWSSKPYLIIKNGEVVGYLTDGNGTINECVLKCPEQTAQVLMAYLQYTGQKQLECRFGSVHSEAVCSLMKVCEEVEVHPSGNYQVLCFRRVLQAYLQEKAARTTLADGEIVIAAGEELLRFEGKNGKVMVSDTTEVPQLRLDRMEAHRFFFGLMAPEFTCAEAANYPFLNSWFPLDFGLSHQDAV